MAEECSGRTGRGFHRYGCTKKGTLEHDGKWWCKQHHPPTVAAKAEARRTAWRSERDAQVAAERRSKALAAARERVVEAAKAVADHTQSATRTLAALYEAVAALEKLEVSNG
jgi:hypothetical protein